MKVPGVANAKLNRLAVERSLPLEARIFPGDPDGIVKLHNKGLVSIYHTNLYAYGIPF